jgi:hypothetical protein
MNHIFVVWLIEEIEHENLNEIYVGYFKKEKKAKQTMLKEMNKLIPIKEWKEYQETGYSYQNIAATCTKEKLL